MFVGARAVRFSRNSSTCAKFARVLSSLPEPPSQPVLVRKGRPLPQPEGWGNAVVLIDKPKGWTSQDVCSKLRGVLRYTGVAKKVGHAGTLDPMATGLLIVCCGKATKLVDQYMAQTKQYSGTLKLGEFTPTYDAESEATIRSEWRHVTNQQLQDATQQFLGDIMQVPPMFSAIKKGGVKLYDMARQGIEIEREPRAVSLSRFLVRRDDPSSDLVDFDIECSKGTYVRSLAHDLAAAVGTHAHLTVLRRDAIGEFSAGAAWAMADLLEEAQAQRAMAQAAAERSGNAMGFNWQPRQQQQRRRGRSNGSGDNSDEGRGSIREQDTTSQ